MAKVIKLEKKKSPATESHLIKYGYGAYLNSIAFPFALKMVEPAKEYLDRLQNDITETNITDILNLFELIALGEFLISNKILFADKYFIIVSDILKKFIDVIYEDKDMVYEMEDEIILISRIISIIDSILKERDFASDFAVSFRE